MTAPRQVLPGTTYLITRRCAQRQFLLRPSKITNAIFLYVLAVAAGRFGMNIHAYCVLSNHFHLILTDPGARLPAFEQYLDSLVARAINASLGRWEAFWAPSSYSAVALGSPADVVDKTAYVLANPVAAGLVRRGRDWPGLWSAPELVGGQPLTVRRPQTFFRENGSMPESVELTLTAPPGFDSPADFRERVAAALGRAEAAAGACESSGVRVVGAERVLAQEVRRRAVQREPRRTLNPRVAARDRWKRIEALQRLRGFLERYRAAWRARRAGDFAALFPPGTYLLRVAHGAPCAAT
ncbi:transposase [Anaeromyxobacter diazotrophicus]|nr:transposase [Anaeromyxobacter diazotrophicus]